MRNRPFARTASLPTSRTNSAAASACAWLSLWMRMSVTADILLLAGAPASGAPHSWTLNPSAWGQEFCQGLNRRDGILTQGQDDGLLFMSLERLDIAGGLGLRE